MISQIKRELFIRLPFGHLDDKKGNSYAIKLIVNITSTLAVILVSSSIVSCTDVDTDWHKYKSRKLEIIGRGRNFVEVTTDGWKIIGKSENKDEYEWGWEITMSNSRDPEKEAIIVGKDKAKYTPLYHLKELHYILYDKDGFELVNDVLTDQYLEYGAKDTYRHTSIISKSKALRASNGAYRIVLSD